MSLRASNRAWPRTPTSELVAGYRETRGQATVIHHRFVPLTDERWTPGTPVRFFLAEVQRSDEAEGRGIIALRDGDGHTRFEGKLKRNGLPTVARGALERTGVQIAEPYWVIDNLDQTRWLVLELLGLALSGALIGTGVRDARRVRVG